MAGGLALRRARPRSAQVLRGRPPRRHRGRPANAPANRALVWQARVPDCRLDTSGARGLHTGCRRRAAPGDTQNHRGRAPSRVGGDRGWGDVCAQRVPCARTRARARGTPERWTQPPHPPKRELARRLGAWLGTGLRPVPRCVAKRRHDGERTSARLLASGRQTGSRGKPVCP